MAARARLVPVLVLGGAGVATFYAAAQWSRSAQDPAEVVVQPARSAAASRPAPGTPRISAPPPPTLAVSGIDALRARSALDSEGKAFTRLSWLPPPPPPAAPPPPAPPPPPPPPTAPALPFTFVGMVERGADKPQAFLTKGDSLLIVAAGDLVDGNTYRVESLSPTQLVLTYLPLDQRQTLDISGVTK